MRNKLIFGVAFATLLATSYALPQTNPGVLQGFGNAGYPTRATPVGAATTATAGGIVNLGIPATPNQFGYVCTMSVSPGSATAAITLTVTISNVVGGPYMWTVGAPVTALGVTGSPLILTFTPCLRTNIVNQQALLNVTALGAGGVNQTAQITGFTQ